MPLFGKANDPEEPSFASKLSLQKRLEDTERIHQKWPDRIPCIVERAESSRNTLPPIDKKKYLVPDDMTFGQFIHVIRKRIKVAPEQAVFLYVNNVLPPASLTMRQIYQEHKGDDGFLSAVYQAENSFGTFV